MPKIFEMRQTNLRPLRRKEGMLRNYSPIKVRRLGLGMNPRNSVLKTSPLNLDHHSHKIILIISEIPLEIFNCKSQF
jgi:hypothetical protein